MYFSHFANAKVSAKALLACAFFQEDHQKSKRIAHSPSAQTQILLLFRRKNFMPPKVPKNLTQKKGLAVYEPYTSRIIAVYKSCNAIDEL